MRRYPGIEPFEILDIKGGGAVEQEVPAQPPHHQEENWGNDANLEIILYLLYFYQGLIEREYMKRSDHDRKMYIYLA